MHDKILAKGSKTNAVTLWEHTISVQNAAHIIFGKIDKPSRTGKSWMRFFRFSDFNKFMKNLEIAILLHDVGKANSGFQAAVRRNGYQIWRHEQISAIIMLQKPIMEALQEEFDFFLILSAVLGHHFKSDRGRFGKLMHEGNLVDIYTGSYDFQKILGSIISTPFPDEIQSTVSVDKDIISCRSHLSKLDIQLRRNLRNNPSRSNLLRAVRSGLILADAAGSTIMRENLDYDEWLNKCFAGEPLDGSYIENKVIKPKVEYIEKGSNKSFQFRPFQENTSKLGDRALLISSCGSGKTFAAWKWIKSQLDKSPKQRVIFLYPTRATATEGFKDYASFAGGTDATLKHGTSDFDLQGMFQNPGDERNNQSYGVSRRLYSLGYWNKRVFAATVDSFLSFMSNNYDGITMLPLISDSVIVIDEIHSFDNRMFGALVNMLNNFDVPVLAMTATISERRKSILVDDCKMDIYPKQLIDFKSLEKLSRMPRYSVQRIANNSDGFEIVDTAFKNNKCIMWVENQVAKCQNIAKLLIEKHGSENIICYHSRYRLMDRKAQHQEAVNRFKEAHQMGLPIVLVTTQVCEMSLDLDADLLISALAPIPSLIQRMGRCNRSARPEDNRIGDVKIYLPENDLPYKESDMKMAEDFLNEITKGDGAISQQLLSDLMENWQIDKYLSSNAYTAFTSDSIFSTGEQFRDISAQYNQNCILDSDLESFVKKLKNKAHDADGYILPVPKSKTYITIESRLPKYLKVAPVIHYDKKLGFIKPGGNDGQNNP